MASSASTSRRSGGNHDDQKPRPAVSTKSRVPTTEVYADDSIEDLDSRSSSFHHSIQDGISKALLRKVDLRLCTIAGILCSLNLLDSGIISSAAVTSMPKDLGLTGDRFSVSIFIFTVSSICAQLPATILMRFVGPPIFFSCTTVLFGLITLCTAFIHSWRSMIALRVLLGISMSGVYPGLTYLISAWYERKEQQLRFAFLQSGEVIILATGSIVNFAINQNLDGKSGLAGWRWMYIVQGSITMFLGLMTYLWIPHFPEKAQKTAAFLTQEEIDTVLEAIDKDRSDAGKPEPFTAQAILTPFLDPKLYAFAVLFFLLNLVSTALSYFLPIILQSGMGFSTNKAILLSAPPYYYAVLPVLLTSLIGDRLRIRGPIIIFNAVCLIIGFCMLGFEGQVTVRYIGTFLATGAYVSNWAALSTYQANNISGQWKRATVAASVSACNGLGGIAGSYIVRAPEAPRYLTAMWVSISSHMLMIALVLACTFAFWMANRRANGKGKGLIEGVEGFRYTY